MQFQKLIFIGIILFSGALCVSAQAQSKTVTVAAANNPLKASPAYAEILLRKTDLEADLEEMLVSYTEDFPKVKTTRYELDLTNAALNKILAVRVTDSAKLTLALGKLLVRRTELAADLWRLKTNLGDEHPDVKRAARKVAIFDQAISEILP